MPHPLSRRAALGGLAALTAATASGCTGPDPSRAAQGDTPAPVVPAGTPAAHRPTADPDVALAATALHDEQTMLERVLATVHAHPRLARPLAGARAAHRAHVDLLTRAVPDGSAGARPRPTRAHPVPATPEGAVAALVQAEDRLARRGRRHALEARSGPFARVLASMAAAAAQQAVHVAAATDRG